MVVWHRYFLKQELLGKQLIQKYTTIMLKNLFERIQQIVRVSTYQKGSKTYDYM